MSESTRNRTQAPDHADEGDTLDVAFAVERDPDEGSDPFVIVYRWVRELVGAGRISPTAYTVYATLMEFHGSDGKVVPRHTTVAGMLNISVRTVTRAVEELRAAGALAVYPRHAAGGRRTTNRYVLRRRSPFPAPVPAPDRNDAAEGGRRSGRWKNEPERGTVSSDNRVRGVPDNRVRGVPDNRVTPRTRSRSELDPGSRKGQHPHSVAADAATAADGGGKPARQGQRQQGRQGSGEDVAGRFKAEVEGRRAHRKTRREAAAEADVTESEPDGWSDPSTETLEQATWDLPVRRDSRGERVYTAGERARLDAADARDRRRRGQTLGQVIEAATGRLDRLSPADLPALDRALAIGGWASEARQAGYEPNVPTLLGLYDRMVERARPGRRIARASATDSGPRGHFARLVEHDDGGLADAVAVALAGADPFDADLGHLDDVAWAEALVEAVRDCAGVGYHAPRAVA